MSCDWLSAGDPVAYRGDDDVLVVGVFSHVVALNSGAVVGSVRLGDGVVVCAPLEDLEDVFAPGLVA